MRDIREYGSCHEENRGYQELLIEDRKRLNKKRLREYKIIHNEDWIREMEDMKLQFRDIQAKFQDILVVHKDISVISRYRLNTKKIKKILQAVKEGYFVKKSGKLKQSTQEFINEYTVYEHSMDLNRHGGKRKRSMSLGIVSDKLLSRNWIEINTYKGKDTRRSHRKIIEK